MGFMDGIGGGGAAIINWDGRAGNHVDKRADRILNEEEFVARIYRALGGHKKFNGKGEKPESRLGSIFPKDEAPERASLGDDDKGKWPQGKFSDGPEDPWTPVIELPIQHKETGEEYLYTVQSKTALAAMKDLLGQCRRLPEGFEPIIRLNVGSFKGKFGAVKKPIFTIIGKVAIETGKADDLFNDSVDF